MVRMGIGPGPWRVFVSHTSELRDYPATGSYVQAVERAISAAGHVVVDMADFPATDQPPAQVCVERVRGCHVYVGVLGTRYGSPVRDRPEVSYTELEFDTATEAGIPRLAFVLSTDAADVGIPLAKLIDREFGDRQDAFRARVSGSGLVRQPFANPDQLHSLVYRSLRALADTQQRVGSGIAREQAPREPVAVRTSRFVNPPPVTPPSWFQGRVVETALVGRDVADPGIRMVTVAGRGGVGKTALVCRLLKGLEAGRIPDAAEEHCHLTVGGIVYLAHNGVHQVQYPHLVGDLLRLLPGEDAARLEGLARDPGVDPRHVMRAVLEAFPVGDPVVVLLDNLESVMDAEAETLAEPALEEALRTVLTAPAHAVTVVATTRVVPVGLLAAAPAAHRLRRLDAGLSLEDAATVLRELDDQGHLGLRDAAPGLLVGLWEHTRGFPRALEAVKAILEGDPSLTPADLIDQTQDLPEDQVVEVLVGQAFDLLDPAAQQVMQALSIFPAPVSAVGVDFLLQPLNPTVNAAPVLSRLVRRQLARVDQGRFHLHPVDRAYALNTIPPGRPGSMAFTLAGLRGRAAGYYAQIRTTRESWRTLDDIGPQLAEFDLRCEAGDHDTAHTVLADITFDYLQKWGHDRLAADLHERLTDKLSDPFAQGANHADLGNCYFTLGRIQAAIEHYQQALTIHRGLGDRHGEANDLGGVGNCYDALGQTQAAIRHHQEGLTITREIGFRVGEANHLGNLGLSNARLGQTETAIRHHQQALTIEREIGYRYGEALDLVYLGDLAVDQDELARAGELYREAIGIGEQTGNAQVLSEARTGLARCQLLAGDLKAAEATAGQAAAIDYPGERAMLALLTGVSRLRQDQPDAAEAAFAQALAAADARLGETPGDYAHLDVRALALRGLALANPQANPGAMAESIESFRRARSVNSEAGVTARTLRLLDQLTAADPGGTLHDA
jgi:tetratricopeptide (TPR) repeat protein